MKQSTNGRVGWVSRNAVLIAENAHPAEKSTPSFRDASIHRLPYWQVNLRAFGASLLRERSS
jgi:hypothetical protein